jgi:tetratricopeptide (TPR) repeat protein
MSDDAASPGPGFEYVLTGRNRRGRRVTEIVRAASGDEAVATFVAQGHSDVVLHTDDVAAPLAKPSAAVGLSPREQVAIRTMGEGRRFLFFVWKSYRSIWPAILIALGIIGFTLAMGQSLYGFALVGFAILLFPPALHLYLSLFGAGAVYLRLLRAVGHARWEEALRLVPRVSLPLSPVELPLLKARALAGLGRLPEALAELDRATASPAYPRHLYWLSQSIIYLDARELEKGLSAVAQAHELAPQVPLIAVSYANRLLAVRREVGRARALVAEARRHAIADWTVPFFLNAEGVIALESGRADDAVRLLAEAVRQHDGFQRNNPSTLPQGARMRANLCLALAATGDTAGARAQLRRAAPLLAAHRELDLLKRCEQAVG